MVTITWRGAPMDVPTTVSGIAGELRHRAAVIADQACDTGGHALALLHTAIADLLETVTLFEVAATAEAWASRTQIGSGAWAREADELSALLAAFAEEFGTP